MHTLHYYKDADLIEFESPQPSSPMPFTVHIHNDVESYVHDLKQYQGMAPCDQTLKKFVVQDFCNKTQSLKARRIFHLHTLYKFSFLLRFSVAS